MKNQTTETKDEIGTLAKAVRPLTAATTEMPLEVAGRQQERDRQPFLFHAAYSKFRRRFFQIWVEGNTVAEPVGLPNRRWGNPPWPSADSPPTVTGV